MLEKVITTSTIGANGPNPGEGFLSLEQADKFIDYTWDAAVLWKEAEKRKMNSPESEWSIAKVGARIVRKATEAVDDGKNASANFTKVSLKTTKLRLDWEVSTESLEDNIEGNDLDEHLVRLFARQFGEDLEDLSQNGDTASNVELLSAFDGWHKQALAKGHVRAAATGAGNGQLSRAHFNQAIKAMPTKYARRKGDLRFYASTNLVQDYLYSQSEQGIVPDEVIQGQLRQFPSPTGDAGYMTSYPFGVELREVPMFDTYFNEQNASTGSGQNDATSYIELTNPRNRIIGMQRQIQVFREFKPKKDAIEYTMFVRFGVAWQNIDAVVTVTDIPVLD